MIQWTTEADEAFQRMKELLEALPTVTASVNGETLIVYLAASEESISAVLLAERGKKQVPVYFISRTLHRDELEYSKLEKLIPALVYAARKLRRYFQAYPIQIEFRGRNSIKGHILADFLAENPPMKDKEIKNKEAKRKEPESENAWKLFTNGDSSFDGSEAGLMLVDPEGKEYTYALRLFEARKPVIKQYLEKEKELLVSFPTYSIEHIKRGQNKKADALSKLASMTFSKLTKEVLVEVLQKKSITQKQVTNVTQKEEDNWMIPIQEFLQLGKLPNDP
ncbi:reverse transcriptase domain-containing protein [Tanacetum coccineum]